MPRRSNGMFPGNSFLNGNSNVLSLQALDENDKKIIAKLKVTDGKLCSMQDNLTSVHAKLEKLSSVHAKLDSILSIISIGNISNNINKKDNSIRPRNGNIDINNARVAPTPSPAPPPSSSSPLPPNGITSNINTVANGNANQGREPYLTSLTDVLSSDKGPNADLPNGIPSNSVVNVKAASIQRLQPQSLPPQNQTASAAVPLPPDDPGDSEDDLVELSEEEGDDFQGVQDEANRYTVDAKGITSTIAPGANICNDNNNNPTPGDTTTKAVPNRTVEDDPQIPAPEVDSFEISFGADDADDAPGTDGDATDGDDDDDDHTATVSGPGADRTMDSPTSTPAYGTPTNVPIVNVDTGGTPQNEVHGVEAEVVKDTPMEPVDAPSTTQANGSAGTTSPQLVPISPQVETAPPRKNVEPIVIDESDDENNGNSAAPVAPAVQGTKEGQQCEVPNPISTPKKIPDNHEGSSALPPGNPGNLEISSIPGVTINNAVQVTLLPDIEPMDSVIPQEFPQELPQETSSSHSLGSRKRRRSESPDMNVNANMIPTSQSPSVLSESEDHAGLDPDVDLDSSFGHGNINMNIIADEEEDVLETEQFSLLVNSYSHSPEKDPDYSPGKPLRRSERSPRGSPGRSATGRKSVTPTRPMKIARKTPITMSIEQANEFISTADEMKSNFNTKEAACPTAVFNLYKRAAMEGDHPLAMLRMGEMLLEGASSLYPKMKKVHYNHTMAGRWIRRAMQHEQVQAAENSRHQYYDVKGRCYSFLGDYIWLGKGKNKSKDSLENFKKGAEIDPKYGQYKVGWWYYKSFGNARTEAKQKSLMVQCIKELEKAYRDESGDAAAILGSIYENYDKKEVQNVAIDLAEGRTLTQYEREMKAKGYYMMSYTWECAAGSNDAGACFEIGFADVDPNFELAVEMYTRSFEMGYTEAATNLGLIYEIGSNIAAFVDRLCMKTAIEWYHKGDKLGDARAAHHLAVIYGAGKHVKKDRKKSVDYFERALRIASEEVVRRFDDVLDQARPELLKMVVAIIIMNDPLTKRAEKIYEKYALKKETFLEDAKTEAVWIMASELKADTYSTLRSAMDAPEKIRDVLGDELGNEVARYLCSLAADYKKELGEAEEEENGNLNTNSNLEEVRAKVMEIVEDPEMQISLQLIQ